MAGKHRTYTGYSLTYDDPHYYDGKYSYKLHDVEVLKWLCGQDDLNRFFVLQFTDWVLLKHLLIESSRLLSDLVLDLFR